MHRQPGLARGLPVARRDVEHEGLVPAHKGIAHQARDVVADRAIHGVLKIQHAHAVAVDHQVARHEIAMHKDSGRRQVGLHDQGEGLVQRVLELALHRHAAVPGQVPLGKERELALQQRRIVGRQHAGPGRELPADQRIDRLLVARPVGVGIVRVDHVEHRLRTEVVEQQEALGLVPVEHLGRGHAGFAQQLRYLHEGLAVLLVGRRVHHDARGRGAVGIDAEIAPEAGVGRCQPDAVGPQAMDRRNAREPAREGLRALRIAPCDGRHGGGCGSRGRGSCHG